jgi:hypothetical protein
MGVRRPRRWALSGSGPCWTTCSLPPKFLAPSVAHQAVILARGEDHCMDAFDPQVWERLQAAAERACQEAEDHELTGFADR